jgi:hypothetical protein
MLRIPNRFNMATSSFCQAVVQIDDPLRAPFNVDVCGKLRRRWSQCPRGQPRPLSQREHRNAAKRNQLGGTDNDTVGPKRDRFRDIMGRPQPAAGDQRDLVADAFVNEEAMDFTMPYSIGIAMFFFCYVGRGPRASVSRRPDALYAYRQNNCPRQPYQTSVSAWIPWWRSGFAG